MSTLAEQVYVESGPICRIVLDRAPLNVLTTALLEDLDRVLAAAAADDGTKVIVLSGAGRVFCAGVDIAEHTADRMHAMIAAFHRAIVRLLGMDVPVVAAVHGAALGGGLELALACDVVIARSDTRIGQPEIGVGVFPPAASALLPRLIGRHAALDLILTGRVLSAEEARAAGVVAQVLPADAFDGGVAAYVAALAARSRPVLRLAKRAVTGGLDRTVGEALAEADRLYLEELMQLRDPYEGLAAFLEKREPVWSDR